MSLVVRLNAASALQNCFIKSLYNRLFSSGKKVEHRKYSLNGDVLSKKNTNCTLLVLLLLGTMWPQDRKKVQSRGLVNWMIL